MKRAILSRTLHQWLTLVVGIQLVLRTVSGFYRVVVDLDFIHGDSLVRNLRVPLATERLTTSVAEISRRYPELHHLREHQLACVHRRLPEKSGKPAAGDPCRSSR